MKNIYIVYSEFAPNINDDTEYKDEDETEFICAYTKHENALAKVAKLKAEHGDLYHPAFWIKEIQLEGNFD